MIIAIESKQNRMPKNQKFKKEVGIDLIIVRKQPRKQKLSSRNLIFTHTWLSFESKYG